MKFLTSIPILIAVVALCVVAMILIQSRYAALLFIPMCFFSAWWIRSRGQKGLA